MPVHFGRVPRSDSHHALTLGRDIVERGTAVQLILILVVSIVIIQVAGREILVLIRRRLVLFVLQLRQVLRSYWSRLALYLLTVCVEEVLRLGRLLLLFIVLGREQSQPCRRGLLYRLIDLAT